MTIPNYMLCPSCPACAALAGVPALSYRVDAHGLGPDDKLLFCAVCRWVWIGGAGEIAIAKAAEVAWHERTDGRKGPWALVLKSRARRHGDQLLLLQTERGTRT